jgi:beta-lactamase regulating signal transducer with metallopeptidase domain
MPISPINIYSLEDITSSIPRSINTAITIPPTSPMTSIPFTQITSIIWFLVVIFILSYSFFNFNKFKKTLKTSYNTKDNIYQSDTIKTPFVLGILKPKIYIPVAIKSHEEEYILEHEKIHIKRYDYIIKLIFYITACIHWFNPLI